jgi:hypothetical protein
MGIVRPPLSYVRIEETLPEAHVPVKRIEEAAAGA